MKNVNGCEKNSNLPVSHMHRVFQEAVNQEDLRLAVMRFRLDNRDFSSISPAQSKEGTAQRCLLIILLQPCRELRWLLQGHRWPQGNRFWKPGEGVSLLEQHFWLRHLILISELFLQCPTKGLLEHLVLCCQQEKKDCHLLTAFPGYAELPLT